MDKSELSDTFYRQDTVSLDLLLYSIRFKQQERPERDECCLVCSSEMVGRVYILHNPIISNKARNCKTKAYSVGSWLRIIYNIYIHWCWTVK